MLDLKTCEDREYAECQKDFDYFCWRHVFVEDANTRASALFKFWPCQRQAAKMLVAGEWLCILKPRRIGMTWLLAAYAVWKVTFFKRKTVVIVNQDKVYAADFLDRCR